MEVDVTAGFATASGAFDESWDGPLVGLTAALATAYRELDPDALGGSYDMDLDTAGEDYDERSLWVRAAFDGAGSSGVVEGQISGADPCDEGDTCTAWAAQVSVGSWGEAGS